MASSLGFVSQPFLFPNKRVRAFNTRFRFVFVPEGLKRKKELNSLARSAKSTQSPYTLSGRASALCRRDGFRFYFTGITSLLFTFPSRYWFTIGEVEYLALA